MCHSGTGLFDFYKKKLVLVISKSEYQGDGKRRTSPQLQTIDMPNDKLQETYIRLHLNKGFMLQN